MKTRVAQIGVSGPGAQLLTEFSQSELLAEAELVATVDPKIILNNGKHYDFLDSLLEQEKVDLISIATPFHTRFKLIDQAISAGCNVLVHGIPTSYSNEFNLLKSKAEANDVLIQVALNGFNINSISACRKLVVEQLGQIKTIQNIVIKKRHESYYLRNSSAGKKIFKGNRILAGSLANNGMVGMLNAFYLADSCQVKDWQSVEIEMYAQPEVEADQVTWVKVANSDVAIYGAFTLLSAIDEDSYLKIVTDNGIAKFYYEQQVIELKINGIPEVHYFATESLLTNLVNASKDRKVQLISGLENLELYINILDTSYSQPVTKIPPKYIHRERDSGSFPVLENIENAIIYCLNKGQGFRASGVEWAQFNPRSVKEI